MNAKVSGRRPFKKVGDGHRWVAGVCGGIAYTFGIPALVVRVIMLILILCTNPYVSYIGGIAVTMYILFWLFAPSWFPEPEDYEERTA